MPACEECHRVKVRCDRRNRNDNNNDPCSRCRRLEIACIPRISRQGQGPKKRKRKHQQPSQQQQQQQQQQLPITTTTTTTTREHTSEDGKVMEALFLVHQQERQSTINNSNCCNSSDDDDDEQQQQQQHPNSSSPPSSTAIATTNNNNTTMMMMTMDHHHYGIRYLIHSWISFALARRSFGLLRRACRLAMKCQVPMNDIFCPSRKSILDPILYHDNDNNDDDRTDIRRRLQWTDLPLALLQACHIDLPRRPSLLEEPPNHHPTISSIEQQQQQRQTHQHYQQRYMMVREAKGGHSRYLATNAFQQDICPIQAMEQTWYTNEHPVVMLFLKGPPDFDKFTKAIHYQMSRYVHPQKPIECVRMNGLQVKFRHDNNNNNNNQNATSKTSRTNNDNDEAVVEERSGITATAATAPLERTKTMDLIYTFQIVNLEHSFYICEFVHPKQESEDESTISPSTRNDSSREDHDPQNGMKKKKKRRTQASNSRRVCRSIRDTSHESLFTFHHPAVPSQQAARPSTMDTEGDHHDKSDEVLQRQDRGEADRNYPGASSISSVPASSSPTLYQDLDANPLKRLEENDNDDLFDNLIPLDQETMSMDHDFEAFLALLTDD